MSPNQVSDVIYVTGDYNLDQARNQILLLDLSEIAGGNLNLPEGIDGRVYNFGIAASGIGVYNLVPSLGDILDENVNAVITVPMSIVYLRGTWYIIG